MQAHFTLCGFDFSLSVSMDLGIGKRWLALLWWPTLHQCKAHPMIPLDTQGIAYDVTSYLILLDKRRRRVDYKHYTTSQFAQKAAVTARTLRFYDKVGLLSPSEYTEAGHRLYSDEDLWSLQQILALKFLGFSLE